jgi:hypothetical protein
MTCKSTEASSQYKSKYWKQMIRCHGDEREQSNNYIMRIVIIIIINIIQATSLNDFNSSR